MNWCMDEWMLSYIGWYLMDGSTHLNGKVNERITEHIDVCLDGSVGGWLEWLSSAALLCFLDSITPSRALCHVDKQLVDYFQFPLCLQIIHCDFKLSSCKRIVCWRNYVFCLCLFCWLLGPFLFLWNSLSQNSGHFKITGKNILTVWKDMKQVSSSFLCEISALSWRHPEIRTASPFPGGDSRSARIILLCPSWSQLRKRG